MQHLNVWIAILVRGIKHKICPLFRKIFHLIVLIVNFVVLRVPCTTHRIRLDDTCIYTTSLEPVCILMRQVNPIKSVGLYREVETSIVVIVGSDQQEEAYKCFGASTFDGKGSMHYP